MIENLEKSARLAWDSLPSMRAKFKNFADYLKFVEACAAGGISAIPKKGKSHEYSI